MASNCMEIIFGKCLTGFKKSYKIWVFIGYMQCFSSQKLYNEGNIFKHQHSIVGKGIDSGASLLSWTPNSSTHCLCSRGQVT